MPRANVWIILMVIAAMLGVWYFGSVHDASLDRVQAAIPKLSEEDTMVLPVKVTPSRNQNRRTQLQNEVSNLQAELAKRALELDSKKKELERLKQQQAALGGTSNLSSQIQSRDLAIQNLMEDLGNYRQAEDDINQSAAVAVKNQDSQAALARAEVDASVQSLEQEMHNTQNELQYWRNVIGAEVVQQPAQIERLQNQLNQQRDQLNNLRTQRVGISARVLNNSQSIQSLAEQARAELRASASATQDQIYSLRSDIDQMGRAQSLSRGQIQEINQKISIVEKDLEGSSQEVRRLQDSIQSKQNEIQAQ